MKTVIVGMMMVFSISALATESRYDVALKTCANDQSIKFEDAVAVKPLHPDEKAMLEACLSTKGQQLRTPKNSTSQKNEREAAIVNPNGGV